MTNEQNLDLQKKKLDEHTKLMKERHEENLYKNAVARAFDIIALESFRLGIEDFQKMALDDLRKAVEIKHKEKKNEAPGS